MKTAPGPPHSLDLALSDFYLLRYVKGCQEALSFGSADEPIEAVQGVREYIEKKTLQAVFLEWMDRFWGMNRYQWGVSRLN
jgi:hypothetical protein